MGSTQESNHQLLLEAHSWSQQKIEDQWMTLLEVATSSMTLADSDYEVKLECIQWIASKLVKFVPVFDLEDLVLKPSLCLVQEYLEEILTHLEDNSQEDCIVFLSLINSLLENTESIVQHCQSQADCGLGEIPSLPRVVPKILFRLFQFLLTTDSSQDLREGYQQCFAASRSLLTAFLSLLEDIKVRTVLEDELEMLVNVCEDLVTFHDVLIPLDFKLACMVWKLYLKLTTKHQAKLINKLDLGLASAKVGSELVKQFHSLRQDLQSSSENKNINKSVTKVSFLIKILLTTMAQTDSVGESQTLFDVLLQLFTDLPSLPSWVSDTVKKKISSEITSSNIKHSFLKISSKEPFINYFISKSFSDDKQEDKEALLMISLELLQLRQGHQAELFDLCLKKFGLGGGGCLEVADKDGRQESGKRTVKVDNYTWILTNLCAYLSSADPDQFRQAESGLISTLLSPSSSVSDLMLVSDILCFVARYSSSKLCFSILSLLHNIVQKIQTGVFSLNLFFINVLSERMATLLSDNHKAQWDRLQLGEVNPRQVKDQWKKLAAGRYSPHHSLPSVEFRDLIQKTVMSRELLTSPELSSSISHCAKLDTLNSSHLYQLVSLLNSSSNQMRSDVQELVKDRREKCSNNTCLAAVFSDLLGLDKLGEGVVKLNNHQAKKPCSTWNHEKSSKLCDKIVVSQQRCRNDLPSNETVKVSKKRKLEEKENIESSVKRVEKEMKYLANQEAENLSDNKVKLLEIYELLQNLTKKIN